MRGQGLSDAQVEWLEDLSKLYSKSLDEYRSEVDPKLKNQVRQAWLGFRDELGFSNTSEADVAALGTLLPLISFLETHSVEEVREISLLMLLSLVDENTEAPAE